MDITVKIDHVGFNGTHWSKRTEAEFIADCIAAGNYPSGISDEHRTQWMKDAYAAIKKAMSPKPAEK